MEGPNGHDIGVGPWSGAWPEDTRLDRDLLEHGDRRNVADRYRYTDQHPDRDTASDGPNLTHRNDH